MINNASRRRKFRAGNVAVAPSQHAHGPRFAVHARAWSDCRSWISICEHIDPFRVGTFPGLFG
jgi:hypothetical protein